jgi:hypothetical protein
MYLLHFYVEAWTSRLGRHERCCFGPLLGWDERPIEAFRSIGAGGPA